MEQKSLKTMVYDRITYDILNGRYKENDIISEKTLIEKFGVSKSPVREALIELCNEGILKSLPRTGYQIVPCSFKEIVDILNLRTDIECTNLRRAIDRITEEKIAAIEANSKAWKYSEQVQETSTHWEKNHNFHLSLCALSENEYAYRMVKQLLKLSSKFFAQYFTYASQNDSESKGDYHEKIIQALKDRSIDRACEYLEKDINNVKEQIQQLFGL